MKKVYSITACVVAILCLGTGARAEEVFTGGGKGTLVVTEQTGTTESVIEITKDGASAAAECGLAIYTAIGGEVCDTAVVCENENTANFVCATDRFACSAASDAFAMAAAFAADLNDGRCPAGVTATASGNFLTITSTVADTECCIFSDEMGTFQNRYLGHNVGALAGGLACSVQNVCDGTSGNEAAAATAGFSYTKAEKALIPTLSQWGLIWLILVLMTAAMVVLTRRRAAVMALGDGYTVAVPPGRLFVPSVFSWILAGTVGLGMAGLAAASWAFQAVGTADVVGLLVSAPVFAYMVHLWIVHRSDP